MKNISLPTMLIAATAASPYIAAFTFSATEARLASPCLQSVGIPVVTISTYVFSCLETLVIRSRTSLFPFKKSTSRMMKLTVWLSAVAIAAPAVPNPSPKIKMGSRIIFRIPPVPIPSMPSTDFPSHLKILFITKEAHIIGAASNMYCP